MNIKTSEIPMTVDAVRQEVMKQNREKVIARFEQKYLIIAKILMTIAFLWMCIQMTEYTYQAILKSIFIFIALIVTPYAIRGIVRKYYVQKLFPTNFELSEEEISKRMIEYMENMLDKMNEEMEDLDKKKEQIIKEDKETSEAYYKVYLDYNNLIAKIDPQYFSCMEGGERY